MLIYLNVKVFVNIFIYIVFIKWNIYNKVTIQHFFPFYNNYLIFNQTIFLIHLYIYIYIAINA